MHPWRCILNADGTAQINGTKVILTLNRDGTCIMDMMGEAEPVVWSAADGKAYIMGDDLYIYGDGNLVYEGAGMVFTKTEDGASSEEMSDKEMLLALLAMMGQMECEDSGEEAPAAPSSSDVPYIGTKFVLTGTSINGINLSAKQLNAAGDYVIFNADGSVELCMSARTVQTLGSTRGKVNVVGTEHDGFCVDYYGTYYNFGITGDGLILDYFGTPRFYEPEGGKKVEEPATPEVPAVYAPVADAAPAVTFDSFKVKYKKNECWINSQFAKTVVGELDGAFRAVDGALTELSHFYLKSMSEAVEKLALATLSIASR